MPRRSAGTVGLSLTAVLLAAAPGPAAAAGPDGDWRWPLEPRPRVVGVFRAPVGPFGPGHRGVDLGGRVGQAVLSTGRGTVAFAGTVAGRGVVSVDHAGGRRTTYEPVLAVVDEGDPVAAGTRLGTLSSAPGHCLPGTCLHWGLRRGEVYLDPLILLGLVRVRLLPVWTDRALGMLRAGREGPRRAVGSRRARCRPGPRGGGSRGPPRW